jgi:hypothetical protein
MDATMDGMRSVSEQQLIVNACLGGAAERGPNSETEPSMECLMTLLWATKVIDRERQRQDEALREAGHVNNHDAATNKVEQACNELEELFRTRSVQSVKSIEISDGIGADGISYVGGTEKSQMGELAR